MPSFDITHAVGTRPNTGEHMLSAPLVFDSSVLLAVLGADSLKTCSTVLYQDESEYFGLWITLLSFEFPKY